MAKPSIVWGFDFLSPIFENRTSLFQKVSVFYSNSFTEPERYLPTKGGHLTELPLALAFRKSTAIVGPRGSNVFSYLPSVNHFDAGQAA
jgi:hypothetical protein